jgi:hypothetical protein
VKQKLEQVQKEKQVQTIKIESEPAEQDYSFSKDRYEHLGGDIRLDGGKIKKRQTY